MLSLQTNGCPLIIDYTFFTFYCPIQKITCINLNSRFISIYLQSYSCFRRRQTSSDLRQITFSIQYPIMIISIAILQLNEIIIADILSYNFRNSKIHWRIFYRQNLSSCHKCTINRSISICIYI